MKKMVKLLLIPLGLMVSGTTTSCSIEPKEIALITDVGDINDGSFNQESWEAVKTYAEEHHKTYDFYRPFNDSDFARDCAVKQAVAKGAKMVVLPGLHFAPTAYHVQNIYPDIHFLLIDTIVHKGDFIPATQSKNVCCVGFNCEYSGFLAGYAVSRDFIQRDLNETGKFDDEYSYGYCGGKATDGVYQFGYGFMQGVTRAAYEIATALGKNNSEFPKLAFKYHYAQVFTQSDAAAAKMKTWYASDVKAVFACGGKLFQSVTEGVSDYNSKHGYDKYDNWRNGDVPRHAARWIGVDSDQYKGLKYDFEKETIITSALKGLKQCITDSLDYHYKGEWWRIGGPYGGGEISNQWPLGLNSRFGRGVTNEEVEGKDYVGIAADDYDEQTGVIRGFNNFTIEQYKNIMARIRPGEGGSDPEIPIFGREDTIPNGAPYWYADGQTRDKTDVGVPDRMLDWKDRRQEGSKNYYLQPMREAYFCNYPSEKLSEIHVE